MSRPLRTAWVALAIAAGTVACGELPQRRYFTLSYPSDATTARGDRATLHPVTIRVDRFDTGLPFDRTQIVYRDSPYQFRYYNYRLWAAKPQRMLRQVALRHLETARVAERVVLDYGQELPDYELKATVDALEEYDSGDVWYGHLAMRFELVRFADQTTVWSYRFDRKKRVAERKLVLVVRALSWIAEEELRRVVAQVDHALSRERGVAPTLEIAPPSRDEVLHPGERHEEEPPAAPAPVRDAPPQDGGEEEIITPDDPPAPQGGRSDDELIVPGPADASEGSGAAAP